MLKLENVTLIAVATQDVEKTVKTLIYSSKDIDFACVKIVSHYKPVNLPDNIIWEKVHKMDSIDDWNNYMFYNLWKHVDTDFGLVIHADGFIVNADSWKDEFLNYDYIGAPWAIPSVPNTMRDINNEVIRVGNSVSIRSRRLMKLPSEIGIPWRKFENNYNEDTQICIHNRHIFLENGIKFADLDIAKYFSHETMIPEILGIKPFAFHKHGWPGHINWNYPRLKAISLLESTNVSNMCDYSFGDHASIIHRLSNSFMKPANNTNKEFIDIYNKLKGEGKTQMTLFIDNVRLYSRPITPSFAVDKPFFDSLMQTNDLLKLCGELSDMNFVIFTGHDDVPIDDFIFDKIPENVITINAVNALSFGGKVKPFYYGLQRKLHGGDNRLDIMESKVFENRGASNLLYVNHSIHTNVAARNGIFEKFSGKPWAFVDRNQLHYTAYLDRIKDHKFMICPIGNAKDCHRNYEVLYMRRVPVMKKDKYLEELFKGFPVLFVNDWDEVTEQLLIDNDMLYQRAVNMDIYNLDLDRVFTKTMQGVAEYV